MDLKNLELNKKVVGVDKKFIKITAERVSEEIAVICTMNPETGNEVMRTHVHVETGYSALKDIDTNFWDIFIDGEKFEGYSFRLIYLLDENERKGKKNSMEVDSKTRTVKINVN